MALQLTTRVLDLIEQWPADHVGVMVVGPEGILGQHGAVDRRFALASVTKPLAASAALLAVEEGAIGLDDPAGPAGSTIRHLLAHASGLTPDSRDTIARPGTRRIYSNSGFDVLAEAFASTTGIPLANYLREGVCQPLGMTATSMSGSPAHSAISTVADLARWTIALMQAADGSSTRIWHRSTIESLSSNQFGDLPGVLPGFGQQANNRWGLGFEIRGDKSPHWTGTRNSPDTFGHFGRSGTLVWIDPDISLGLIGLGDADFGPWAVDLWPRLADAVVSEFGVAQY